MSILDKIKENKVYLAKLWGVFFILGGSYFLVEHIMVWDEIAFFDFIGHEWLGFILILVGIALNITFRRKNI